ncbi:MAG: energy transducer TonB [Terracidiphilus sp.]|jgi:TonB family protein
MLKSPLRSAARRVQGATPRFLRIAAFAFFAALVLYAAAAGNRGVKSRVTPQYPELARHLKIEGTVVVEAVVDPAGKVTDVKAVTGSKVLAYAAEEAVRKWTFVPAPEKSTENVEIKFALGQ